MNSALEICLCKSCNSTYLLTIEVGNFIGVGRFVLGLTNEIKVIYPQA